MKRLSTLKEYMQVKRLTKKYQISVSELEAKLNNAEIKTSNTRKLIEFIDGFCECYKLKDTNSKLNDNEIKDLI